MKKNKNLENSIVHLTCLLNKLKSRIDDNEDYNVAYNRLLIQRAELRKKQSDIRTSNIIDLFNNNIEKLKYWKSNKKEKLICDYFS